MGYFKTVYILIVIFLCLVILNNTLHAGEYMNVVINEVLIDPIGEDSGNEWIELYNPSDTQVVIDNWKILNAGTTFKELATFSGIIPPKDYFLICESKVEGCNVYVTKLGIQNGGGATDALRILNNQGENIDEIFYDTPNINNLADYTNNVVVDSMCAVIGNSGESLGRLNHKDSDNSMVDFIIFSTPTPGSENKGTLLNPDLPQTGHSPIFLISLLIIIFFGILLYRIKLYIDNHVKE